MASPERYPVPQGKRGWLAVPDAGATCPHRTQVMTHDPLFPALVSRFFYSLPNLNAAVTTQPPPVKFQTQTQTRHPAFIHIYTPPSPSIFLMMCYDDLKRNNISLAQCHENGLQQAQRIIFTQQSVSPFFYYLQLHGIPFPCLLL